MRVGLLEEHQLQIEHHRWFSGLHLQPELHRTWWRRVRTRLQDPPHSCASANALCVVVFCRTSVLCPLTARSHGYFCNCQVLIPDDYFYDLNKYIISLCAASSCCELMAAFKPRDHSEYSGGAASWRLLTEE